MLAYPRSGSSAQNQHPATVRIIGIGNAGVHLADQLTMAGKLAAEVIAMNTDSQSLASSISSRKIPLGPKSTRGLGAGGDPELGLEAAEESLEDIRLAMEGADIIFLIAGLGGGTASGAISLIAETAKETGATLFAIVTTPFAFEGRRRAAQAAEALADLSRHATAIIHFKNDRMSELASPKAGIEETFATSDTILTACVASITGLLRGGGPVPLSLADILAATKGGTAGALFGRGESSSDNRAHEALERALKSPLLDRGRLLGDSHAVLAHISGPPSLSFAEVSTIMQELSRHTADEAQIFFGVSSHGDSSAPITVTLLGNYAGENAGEVSVPVSRPRPEPVSAPIPEIVAHHEPEPAPLIPDEAPAAASIEEEPVVKTPVRPVREMPKPAAKPAPPKVKQETLQFEPVARGRFEKSEPTIVEGEDLDVPTFLRMRGKP